VTFINHTHPPLAGGVAPFLFGNSQSKPFTKKREVIMASVFTRTFTITFQDGSTTPALIVANGSIDAKPKTVVEWEDALWRYRKQLVDKNSGELLPEYLYIQDNSVKKVEKPEAFFAAA